MLEGEFESVKAMHAVVPSFIPIAHTWGPLAKGPENFLLSEFREVGQQPPAPGKLTMRLAELHKSFISPTGKFGFHVTTCHGRIPQYVGWESSWEVMFNKILGRAMDIDEEKHGEWEEFNDVRGWLFDFVIPRLLRPLQSGGKSIKPCLIHGDLWDENCTDDMNTGEPFVFDAGSVYAHNEYEIGYWRPIRHRLSNRTYFRSYKSTIPCQCRVSGHNWALKVTIIADSSIRGGLGCTKFTVFDEVEYLSFGTCTVEWTAFRVGTELVAFALLLTRAIRVYEDMKTLCRKFCPADLKKLRPNLIARLIKGLTLETVC